MAEGTDWHATLTIDGQTAIVRRLNGMTIISEGTEAHVEAFRECAEYSRRFRDGLDKGAMKGLEAAVLSAPVLCDGVSTKEASL